MFTTLALASLLSASALAQSSSSSSASSSSSSSSDGTLTTSFAFFPDQSGTLAASIIGINNGATTMALECPAKSIARQCALTEDSVITITESTTGTSTDIIDFTSKSSFSTEGHGVTAEASITLSLHCEITGTTAGACTTSVNAPESIIDATTISVTNALDNSTAVGTTTVGPTDITMVPLLVTAGQQILASASSSSSAAAASGTHNAANGHNVGTGVTGAFLAGVLGFAVMA